MLRTKEKKEGLNMATLKSLKEAVIEAVAILDECDGSRSSSNEAIDAAREILADEYGPEFDDDLAEYAETSGEEDADGDGIPDDDEQED